MNEEFELEEYAPWLVLVITLLGGVLRLFRLDHKGMWLDETFSVWLAGHNVGDLLQWVVKIDQHPPLYYLLLHFWMGRFGDTPYDVRLLSVFFGTATIPIIYLIGKRMSGAVVGLAAAVILAFSLYNISFAQETRMYTLLTFNAGVAIYALVRLLTDGRAGRPMGSQLLDALHLRRVAGPDEPDAEGGRRDEPATSDRSGWRAWISRHHRGPICPIETDLTWGVFIVFSVATMLSHNTAVLFPLATNLFVLGLMLWQRSEKSEAQCSFRAPSFGNWIKAQIGIFLLWSPWLPFFFRQARTVDARFWIPEPTWDAVIRVLQSFLNPSAPLPTGLATAIWGLYALFFCLGVIHFRKRFSQFVFLALLIAIPFLGELIVSLRRPIFYDRTLIWTTIPLFLILAAGVAQLRFRFLVVVAVGMLGTINLFSAGDYFRFYQKEDWSTAAGYVAYYAEQDDLILFNSNFVVIPFNYYFRTYEDLYRIRVEKQGVPLDLFQRAVLEPEMTAEDIPPLLALLQGHDRVWLVYSHDSYTDPRGLIPQTLAAEMELTRQREFQGGLVQLYENP